MAAHEFCERMDDDVGAMLDRPAEIWRRQRVVDDERHAGLLAILAIASMSVTMPPGLAIDSMNTALVRGEIAASKLARSSVSAHTTFQPKS